LLYQFELFLKHLKICTYLDENYKKNIKFSIEIFISVSDLLSINFLTLKPIGYISDISIKKCYQLLSDLKMITQKCTVNNWFSLVLYSLVMPSS